MENRIKTGAKTTVYELKPTACEKYPTTHQKNRKLKNTTYTFVK